MANNSAQIKALIQSNGPTIDVKRIVSKYLFHWPLFLIGIVVALAAGFAYLKLTKPVYQIKASLIINNDKKTPDQKTALQEIDLINSNKSVENEVEVLKSNQLIKKVVEDLELWISYQKKTKLNSTDLYKASPVKLILLSATRNYKNPDINIIVKDKSSFYIKTPSGGQQELSFNNTYTNSFGDWKLEPTKDVLKYSGSLIKISVADPDGVAAGYQKAIDVSLPNKLTSTIVLAINDNVAERGKDILNQLLTNYKQLGTIARNKETENTIKFLDQRVASLSRQLNSAEQGIEGFKSSRGLTDLTSDSKISLENMQSNTNRLNDVNIQLNVLENIERKINSPQGLDKTTAVLGVTDPTLTNLIGRLSDLQLQRERLLATTPETNPDFEPINRQITITKSAIKENVKTLKQSLVSTQENLKSYNSGFESSIKDIPTAERQYGSKTRQKSIIENLYTYLLQKREELSVKYASELADDHVVDNAYIEAVKRPTAPITLGVAFLLGILLPAGLIYTRNSLNDTITDVQEIKDALNLPIIGQLQYEEPDNELIITKAGTNALSEQFKALRINLNYNLGNKPGSVTLLTSSISGEGKSFIGRHLSVALAYSGKKTVVLEMDMRKPQISKLFNLESEHAGISDYLNGDARLNQIIRDSGIVPNLHVISCGKIVDNPSELLEKDELRSLIETLRGMYDCVILDSPAAHLVPDAMVMFSYADIILYVIRQGYTKIEELDFIQDIIQQKQLSNINIIFNGIKRIQYGYGYSYNNNYYTDNKKSRKQNSVFTDFSSRF
ncbi:polysaccharide biosynthesis tyrosine autokinase [Mucilaginibacter robiniae]|uniref:non-specific protein-tyrosine kinase n=1 Tax=Mucilaginibacter robiniae TaxID=2728022 RepID=A0A7L5E0R1_9SPHI|nr:polysaccharide biosynthesis tyrosine autokinase [Mucilaginibacter robiniae]QJD94413.1 polysaccharide biosynthesis tyrosine autokinase [Mucilaginibacter robiniae]